MKILVADDNLQAQHVLSLILRRSGHDCIVVSNGQMGLARLREESGFDAIVSDVLMPDMDGFQFCREVKNTPALRNVPFLFYSATYADPRDRELGLALGAAAYLIKPAEPRQVIEAILAATQRATANLHDGTHPPSRALPEEVLFRLYNSRLVNKLESKMLELGQANQALEKVNRDLVKSNRALGEEVARRVEAERAANVLQQQLYESQKMEILGVLASGVAHDFNNLLAIIVGNTSCVAHALPERHPMQECLSAVLSAANRASERAGQILGFSRRGEQTLVDGIEHKAIDLAEAVSDAVQLLRGLVPPSVRLEVALPRGVTHVGLDTLEVHQIVINLGVNAIHAMPKGGTLSLEVSESSPPPSAESGVTSSPVTYGRLRVRDTGVGMDKDTQRRAFELFFTTKERGKGTGLGLPMVHRIVTDRNGLIVLDSRLGEGTQVDVYFVSEPQYDEQRDTLPALPE